MKAYLFKESDQQIFIYVRADRHGQSIFTIHDKHRLGKTFAGFVNKIKSTDASLKLPNVYSQLNMNKRGSMSEKSYKRRCYDNLFDGCKRYPEQAMTLTSFDIGISVYVDRVKKSYKTIVSHSTSSKFSYLYYPSVKDYSRKF